MSNGQSTRSVATAEGLITWYGIAYGYMFPRVITYLDLARRPGQSAQL